MQHKKVYIICYYHQGWYSGGKLYTSAWCYTLLTTAIACLVRFLLERPAVLRPAGGQTNWRACDTNIVSAPSQHVDLPRLTTPTSDSPTDTGARKIQHVPIVVFMSLLLPMLKEIAVSFGIVFILYFFRGHYATITRHARLEFCATLRTDRNRTPNS